MGFLLVDELESKVISPPPLCKARAEFQTGHVGGGKLFLKC